MGNKEKIFGSVFLFAADLNIQAMQRSLEKGVKVCEEFNVYTTNFDLALWVSSKIHILARGGFQVDSRYYRISNRKCYGGSGSP